MATAKEIFEDTVENAIECIGRLATYIPKVGNQVASVPVDVEIISDPRPDGFSATVLEPETTLEYFLSDVGSEADIGDKFTMQDDNTVYFVKELLENDGRSVKVVVKIAS